MTRTRKVRLADLHHNRSKARRIRDAKNNRARAASSPEIPRYQQTKFGERLTWPSKGNARRSWMLGDTQRRKHAEHLRLLERVARTSFRRKAVSR